jgi:hypothetical protein
LRADSLTACCFARLAACNVAFWPFMRLCLLDQTQLNVRTPFSPCPGTVVSCFSGPTFGCDQAEDRAKLLMVRRMSGSHRAAGCPLAKRTNSCREWSTSRAGVSINANRIALSRFFLSPPGRAKIRIAACRLKASSIIPHHAALAPNFPLGKHPPARSVFITACASSLFPQRS